MHRKIRERHARGALLGTALQHLLLQLLAPKQQAVPAARKLCCQGLELFQARLRPVAMNDHPRCLHKALCHVNALTPVTAIAQQLPLWAEALQARIA
jgi:hypothetical protein